MTSTTTADALPDLMLETLIRAALAEDLGRGGDITSRACVPADARLTVEFRARVEGRICGVDCARIAIALLDPTASFESRIADGDDVAAGAVLARVEGRARAILAAERVALNLLGRLSGIATATRAYVRAVEGLAVRIADTRKTTPGLRALEKAAVVCGGGINHRFGLDDAILIKDNHIIAAGGITAALAAARRAAGHLINVEIEVDCLNQLGEAIEGQPDVVMIDNFSLDDMRKAVDLVHGRARVEASGGVTLQTVRAIAETGVDVISVGALTHSVMNLDIGLDAA